MAWYLELTYNYTPGDAESIDKTDELIEKTLGQEYEDADTLFTDNMRSLTFEFSTKEDAEAAAEKVKQLFKEQGIQGGIHAIYQYEDEED